MIELQDMNLSLGNFLRKCFVLGLIFFLPSAFAADYHSPRTDALGGAGHASPLLTDSIYLNPSFTSLVQTHALAFDYLVYNGNNQVMGPQGLTDVYGHNLNLSVLDGSPESLFQAGVGYTRREDASMIHIGASKAFVNRFGVGIGSKFIFPTAGYGSRVIDGTISGTAILSNWFQTAVIVDNIAEAGKSIGFYREFTVGTKVNVDGILLIYFDPNWTPNYPTGNSHLGYQAGIEFPFFQEVFLRVGSFTNSNIPFENVRGDGAAIGAGWIGPKLSFDYAFTRAFNPLSVNSHNFQVTLYF